MGRHCARHFPYISSPMLKIKRLLLPLFLFLFALAVILAGCSRTATPAADTTSADSLTTATAVAPTAQTPASKPAAITATPTRLAASPTVASGLAIYCDPSLPAAWRQHLQKALRQRPVMCVENAADARIHFALHPLSVADGEIGVQRFYAVVAPFATIRDDVSLAELQARWMGEAGPLLVAEEAAGPLSVIFGEAPDRTIPAANMAAALQADDRAWGVLPFEQLDPSYKVLSIDGKNVLDKRLAPADYPLAVALTLSGPDANQASAVVQNAIQPATNRDVQRMTTLIMTGVTAMSRGTAAKMEEKGYVYPALVISNTLSAADITHVSNEAPFIKDCPVNNTYMNLILCSDYPYLQTLRAIGVDIVGLSGNHVNDYGREGALESLQFYKDQGIPVYGSGVNEEEACKPLMYESNGNSYAFLAALAWWPEEAWATASEPGACYYYNNRAKILERIHQLSQQVDIVSVELQFEETYNPWPTRDQVAEFRALHDAGADIVTGVQSHVPQAVEPYGAQDKKGPAVIVYGLGNLFFDQMQSWETRTGLIARYTIYEGRLLSAELLTTVLEDFAQPRWATPQERAEILRSIFDAAPPRDKLPAVPTPTPAPTPTAAPQSPAGGDVTALVTPTPTLTPTPQSTALHAPSLAAPHAQPTPPPVGVAILSWPVHHESSGSHFYLARPTSSDYNQLEDAGYAFGSTAGGRYRVHHGVDIANPAGTPLLAPADGLVVYAGPDDAAHTYGPYPDFYGNVLVFQLDQTWQGRTVYALYGHMQSLLVTSGQHVARGQQVGLTGMAGIAIGPHVHVEVRLDAPLDYNNVFNAALWMEPFAGYGVIAGQVLTPDGRSWHDVPLHVYRWTDNDSRLYRVFDTYALDEGLRPDPELGENAALGSVPAGDYEVVLKLNGSTWHQRLHVNPGEIGFFNFVVAP